jgi:hypothetical protein
MNARIKQLRDLVVALDRADRNIEPMAPDAYQAAARTALKLTNEEMGCCRSATFAGPVSALQTWPRTSSSASTAASPTSTAPGRAPVALTSTRSLLRRLRTTTSSGASREIPETCWRVRACAGSRGKTASPSARRNAALARRPPARPLGDRFQR